MEVLGFTAAEIQQMVSIIAAVLLLGNVVFEEDEASTDDAGTVGNPGVAASAAANLQLDPAEFTETLTTKVIAMKGETIRKPMNAGDCRDIRDT